MAVFVTSDHHFGHRNIIKFCDRPFANLEEMQEGLIERHNSVVSPEDHCFFLGDVALHRRHVQPAIERMNGHKYLIYGNHDECHAADPEARERKYQRYRDFGFEAVARSFDLRITHGCVDTGEEEVFKFKLSHYPTVGDSTEQDRFVHKRPIVDPGWYLLHGHTHSKERIRGNEVHVGVDAWDYYPVPLSKVLELIMASR